MQRGFGAGAGGAGAGVGTGTCHVAHPAVVMVASPWGPPVIVQVSLLIHVPPDGLGVGPSVGRSGRWNMLDVVVPKLAQDVEVTQTPPRGPPLHSVAVVDERHTCPGGAAVGAGVNVGKLVNPPPNPPLSAGLVLVGREVSHGGAKSGGVPVGFALQ